MHAVFVACLGGGFVATMLFAALGALGGAGHAHTGHLPTSGTPHTHALGTPHTHTPGAHGPHGHAIKGSGLHGATGRMPAIPHRVAATFGWTLSWFSPLVLA